MSVAINLAERGLVPDVLTRFGIRRLLHQRLREESVHDEDQARSRLMAFVQHLRASPIAIEQDAANKQHYEVPPAFYQLVLGDHLKYSSCWWEDDSVHDLSTSEAAMLDLTMERAGLVDGQDILEIGCGWGSLTLAMAQRFPHSEIHAISNSAPQRKFIEGRCDELGLSNVTIETVDIAQFTTARQYDRVVSVECFEHCRNYAELFGRIRSWLRPEGQLFVHVFCHQSIGYPFEVEGDDNWMGRHFFTGGIMPSFDLFRCFSDDLQVVKDWRVNGQNYALTARAWLENIDRHRDAVIRLFTQDLGDAEARVMFQRWRMFFMACEELFGFRNGSEWMVGHYLLRPNTI